MPAKYPFIKLRPFAIFCLLFLVFSIRLFLVPKPQYRNGDQVKITATLKTQPLIRGNIQEFSLKDLKIVTWADIDYHYGDRLLVQGIVKNNALEWPRIEIMQFRNGGLMGLLAQKREEFARLYSRILPEPQASLLSGIVLGAKENLPKSFRDDLRKTGTTHIVVASGMNVSILAGTMFSFLLMFFKRRLSTVLSFLLIWIYVGLAGGEAPIVRAGIMGSLTFLALVVGREADAWRALGLSAFLMLFIDPKLLIDLGFQLSFLATFGILFFTPLFNNWFKKIPTFPRHDLSQTLGAQIATLPVILLNFGTFSCLSPLINLLIVIFLPVIMRLGLIGLVVPAVLWLTYPLLTYIVKIVEIFS